MPITNGVQGGMMNWGPRLPFSTVPEGRPQATRHFSGLLHGRGGGEQRRRGAPQLGLLGAVRGAGPLLWAAGTCASQLGLL